MAIPSLNCDNTTKDKDAIPICRICHCSDDSELITVISASNTGDCTSPEATMCPSTTLITPCFCSGSLRYVHHYCLQQWIRSSNHRYCELCKFHFKLTVKSKPLHKVSYFWALGREKPKRCKSKFYLNLVSIRFIRDKGSLT